MSTDTEDIDPTTFKIVAVILIVLFFIYINTFFDKKKRKGN